jgi:DNA-binding transcriptional LysR family regulator
MDVTHLRSLLALAETGSLTRAAERLNYAPSSVSAHLRSIETELGIELTEPLTIAAVQSIAAYGLPAIAAQLAGLDVTLSMRTVTSCAENVRGVAEGEHDVGLTLQERAAIERFYERVAFEVLCDVPIVVTVAPTHRLALAGAFEIGALRGETLIETEPGCGYREAFAALLDAADVPIRERFTFEDFTAIRALARAGVGISVLPRFVVDEDLRTGALVELPLVVPGEFAMVVAWRRDRSTEPLRKVLDVIRAGAPAMMGAPALPIL